jgi:hypothetical protein
LLQTRGAGANPPRPSPSSTCASLRSWLISVKRILTALGLNPPEDEKPPPIREVVRVPVDDEGREIQAS